MEVKEFAKSLIEKYTKIQGKLYQQIERVEYSINLVNERYKSKFLLPKTKNKLASIVLELNKYKALLQGHAYYVDIKLSVLTKESKKPEATIQSLNDISKYLYKGKRTIEMPQTLVDDLAKLKIVFNENDKVVLSVNDIDLENENDLSL